MTDAEKQALVVQLVNDATVTTDIAATYLALAKANIMERCYPFGDSSSLAMPTRYDVLQCELAARYIHRRGIEGETSDRDNGVHRVFESPNDEDLLKEVMQVAMGVLR